MTLAYRGASVIVLAPALAMLAVAFSGEVPLLAAYTQIFMPALAKFLAKYFPIFLLGALFGKLMDESGCAQSIANRISSTLGSQHAILAIVLCVAVLTYGGVSLFVVGFAILPLASSVFQHANIPRRLIPGTIALGSGTFTMTSLPGNDADSESDSDGVLQNNGIRGARAGHHRRDYAVSFLGMLWLNRRARLAAQKSEGYGCRELRFRATPMLPQRTTRNHCRVLAWRWRRSSSCWCATSWPRSFGFPRGRPTYLAEPRYGGVTMPMCAASGRRSWRCSWPADC